MRLLVDENLSVRIAGRLGEAGHDAVHVTAVGLGITDDDVILKAAADDDQIVLTADADFSTWSHSRAAATPRCSGPLLRPPHPR